ncbi:MAG: hypothetical protein AB7I33_06705 [Gemmatimonadales bacterium]
MSALPLHLSDLPPVLAEPAGRGVDPWSVPIRDLGLTITGTRLEPIIAELESELERLGLTRVRPRCYLSTEWGVPFGTVAMAIPFYLARQELTEFHARRVGHVEGMGRADILRYLRHEMGHVVNYAYRLYEREEWVRLFGSIDEPYPEDEYRPKPFSRRFVQHLPGWYAQRHPDEDWSETFAVWMTPGLDWRARYRTWPDALAKLEYCDRLMAEVRDTDPLVTTVDLDEPVGEIDLSVEELYRQVTEEEPGFPLDLDDALWAIFEELETRREGAPPATLVPAAHLIRRMEGELLGNTYRWTGHFPERTRILVHHLAARAEALRLACAPEHEAAVTVALTTIVTALAMTYVARGAYETDGQTAGRADGR